MAYTEQLLYDPMKTIDSATFTGSYQALGTVLVHPASIVKIINASTVSVTISTDGGTSDHDFLPANSFALYDCTANRPSSSPTVAAPKGRQYMIKGSAGTGSVYLILQYINQA